MKRRTMLWQALKKLDKKAYLDAAGKVLLGYRVICAFILKACIPELADYSIEYIENECIIDDPIIAAIHVHRNTCDEDGSEKAEVQNDVTFTNTKIIKSDNGIFILFRIIFFINTITEKTIHKLTSNSLIL